MDNIEGIVADDLARHVKSALNAPDGMSEDDLLEHLAEQGCPDPKAALYAARLIERIDMVCDIAVMDVRDRQTKPDR
jgi:hypothetical protein